MTIAVEGGPQSQSPLYLDLLFSIQIAHMAGATAPAHILIIGAGVFGLSTALALRRRPAYSDSRITVADAAATLPNPSGSSVDSSRIVRADYEHAPYARLAVEAQQLWRDTSDAGWGGQGRYRETGLLLTGDGDGGHYVRQAMVNVRKLAESGATGLELRQLEELPNHEAIIRASGYGHANGDSGYVNWSSGWADAEASVAYVLEQLQREGGGKVEIKSGCQTRKLLYQATEGGGEGIDEKGASTKCIGAELDDGTQILADLVIVAAGAWSPTLVNLQGRALATGQVLAYISISEDEQQAMRDRPTIINFTRGMFIIPPVGRELKIARHAYGYLNPQRIRNPDPDAAAGDDDMVEVSVPEIGIPVPREGQEACRDQLREVAPELSDRPFTKTRICWYCDT